MHAAGMVPMQEPVTEFVLEAPAGLIPIRAQCSGGKCTEVTLSNVPAFAEHLGITVDVPTLGPRSLRACAPARLRARPGASSCTARSPPPLPGPVEVDVAFGGMWYAIVDAASIGLARLAAPQATPLALAAAVVLTAQCCGMRAVAPSHPTSTPLPLPAAPSPDAARPL